MTEAWTQLSLTGDEDHTEFHRDEVLVINPAQSTNGERVRDLARLGYFPEGERVLDPTYGYGNMWTCFRPEQLWIGDINPDRLPDGLPACDFRSMPYEDRFFGTTLYDPPYRFHGTPTDTGPGGHDDLYGTHLPRTRGEQLALIFDGAVECGRVTDRYLIVKCQDQVVAGSTFFQTTAVADHLKEHGWVLNDRLLLMSYRPQPAGRAQRNARNNFSAFLVFIRADPSGGAEPEMVGP